jgi:hypothetical protein
MPATLHDSSVRSTIELRLRALTPTSRGRWGKMSVDQMLWHVNEAMAAALGERQPGAGKGLLPRSLLKFVVLNLPWTKGAPTQADFVARGAHDFAEQQARCLSLVEKIATRSIEGVWDQHPLFGAMTGLDVSRLHAKHLDHHLRQFGV